MKKLLYVALLALTMGFMASCKSGGSSSYTPGGPMPSIDATAGTVNGKAYDTKTEKCWKVVITATANGKSESETEHVWDTEFGLVAGMEEMMWTIAQTGKAATASYTYSPTPDSDYEACMSHYGEK